MAFSFCQWEKTLEFVENDPKEPSKKRRVFRSLVEITSPKRVWKTARRADF